jgi:hypothetical protein
VSQGEVAARRGSGSGEATTAAQRGNGEARRGSGAARRGSGEARRGSGEVRRGSGLGFSKMHQLKILKINLNARRNPLHVAAQSRGEAVSQGEAMQCRKARQCRVAR